MVHLFLVQEGNFLATFRFHYKAATCYFVCNDLAITKTSTNSLSVAINSANI